MDARSILYLSTPLGSGWAPGGHPGTDAHPDAEWTRFRAKSPLWASHGLVGARTQFACGIGPAGDGETFPEVYSGLAAMGLTPCRAPQVLRRRVGRHSQPVNPHPMRRREKAPCLSSNRSTMESMIDSGKIHMVDTAVESQPGRATNNTRSRSRPKRALNYPFLPMAKRVPVMRNRRGILCSPDTGFRK